MSSNVNKIRVEFFGRDKTLGKSFKDAWKHADTFDKKMKLLGTRMQTMGRTMTMGVTLPVVAGLAAATKAAMDDERSQRALAEQIRNTTKATDAEIESVEDFINVQARATGVADDELRPAFAKLVTATGDLGRAQELLAVAQDTAAGTGRGLDSVITAMMKGQQGSVDLFQRMGVATKDAEGNTMSFDEVLTNLKEKFDGLAETKADPFDKLRVAFGELAESLGTFLVPVMETLAEHLADLAAWLEDLSPGWRKLAVYGALAAAALGPVLSIVGAMLTVLPKLGAAFTMLTNPIGLIIAGVTLLAVGLVKLYKENETFRNLVNKVWGWLSKYVPAAVDQVVKVFRTWWEWMKKVYSYAKEAFTKIRDKLRPVGEAAGWVKDKFAAVASWIRDNWSTISKYLKLAFGPIWLALEAAKKLYSWLAKDEAKAGEGNFGSGGGSGGGGGGGGAGGSFASGGVATGPKSGYPVTLHGTELIVPLEKAFNAAALGGQTVVNVYLDSEPIAARVEVRQAQRARVNARTKGLALA